jgi:hypothetical protein
MWEGQTLAFVVLKHSKWPGLSVASSENPLDPLDIRIVRCVLQMSPRSLKCLLPVLVSTVSCC